MRASSRQKAELTTVVDVEGERIGIEISILGTRAIHPVGLEDKASRVLDFIPGSHIATSLEWLSQWLNRVTHHATRVWRDCEK